MKDRLGNHIQQVRGVSYKPSDLSESLSDSYTTLLRANNISDGKINFDSVQFVSSSKVSPEQILRTNDILVCSSSGSLSLVGKSALYKKTGEHTFGAFCKVVRATGKLLPQYIAFYMCSKAYRRHIENIANGANINNLRNEHLDDILLPIPSENKQNAIIAKLEKAQSVIFHRNTQLAKLDELVKCRFVEMFGDPVIDSQHLGLTSLEHHLEEIQYGTSTPPTFSEDGFCFIRATNIKSGRINMDDMKYISAEEGKKIPKCRLKGGELIIVRSGVNTGDTCIVDDCYADQYAGYDIIIRLKKTLNPIFLNALLNSSYMEMIIKPLTRRAAQPHINAQQIKSLPIIQASIEKQNAFATFVRRIDKLRFVDYVGGEQFNQSLSPQVFLSASFLELLEQILAIILAQGATPRLRPLRQAPPCSKSKSHRPRGAEGASVYKFILSSP